MIRKATAAIALKSHRRSPRNATILLRSLSTTSDQASNPMRSKHLVRYTSLAFALVLAVVPAALAALSKGRVAAPFTPELKPGDYVWHPEVSPAGPVVIIVSLPDQVMYVYRNGVRIGRSTVSSGSRASAHRPVNSLCCRRKSVTNRTSTKARRCLTCTG